MTLRPSRDTFITCAVTGAGDTTGRSDKVPVSPRQIADACLEANAEGAAVVHIHVRDPRTGKAARHPALYAEVVQYLRESRQHRVLKLPARPPRTAKAAPPPDLYAEVVQYIRESGQDMVLNLTAGMGGDLTLGSPDA